MYEYHFFNELNAADYPETKAKTIAAEIEDTRITEHFLFDELDGNPLYTSATATRMPLYDCVDLEYIVNTTTGNSYKFGVEVKRRNKTPWSMKRYPFAPLRLDKLQNLQGKAAKEHYSALYYIVLLNASQAYIYDLLRVDWNHVELKPWSINVDNQRPDLGRKTYDTYFLPLTDATIKDIKPYYNADDNEEETEQV